MKYQEIEDPTWGQGPAELGRHLSMHTSHCLCSKFGLSVNRKRTRPTGSTLTLNLPMSEIKGHRSQEPLQGPCCELWCATLIRKSSQFEIKCNSTASARAAIWCDDWDRQVSWPTWMGKGLSVIKFRGRYGYVRLLLIRLPSLHRRLFELRYGLIYAMGSSRSSRPSITERKYFKLKQFCK